MSYRSAAQILPADLLEQVQKYTDGEYVYIPRLPARKRPWGSVTAAKQDYDARNRAVYDEHLSGCSSKELSEKYFLSEKSIQRIVRRMKREAADPPGKSMRMKCLVLMGSPRIHGNTAELAKPFMEELKADGAEVRYVTLADKDIRPCKGCYACQEVAGEYGCVQRDDMDEIVRDVVWADAIILATPIYSWYCPTAMKSMLDRHYGLNKFYGRAEGSLWAGRKVGILATHGYEKEYALSPFETGIRRLCEHSDLRYIGCFSVRDTDNLASFQSEAAIAGARAFARLVLERAD